MSDEGALSVKQDDLYEAIRSGKTVAEYEGLAERITIDPEAQAFQEALQLDWPGLEVPELPGVRTVEKPDPSAGQWLTHYVEYANKCSPMSPPIFNEAMGLWVLSATVARRVCLRVSAQDIYPNLYVLLIGPPGLVRKTSSLSIAARVTKQAGVMLLPSIGTIESLSIELSHYRQPVDIEKNPQEYERWVRERALAGQRGLLLDEISGLFDAGRKDYMAQLKPTLLHWYDCPDELPFNMTVSRGRATVEKAFLALAGATTPGAMQRYFGKQAVEWGDGTWSRFNLLTFEILPPFHFFDDAPVEPEHGLVERLGYLFNGALKLPEVKVAPQDVDSQGNVAEVQIKVSELETRAVTVDPDTWEAWKRYTEALHTLAARDYRQGTKKLSALYNRIHMHAIKVAILLALADWADDGAKGVLRVTMRHWNRAQWISERWRASAHRVEYLVSGAQDPAVGTVQEPGQVLRDAEALLNVVANRGQAKDRDFTQAASKWSGDRKARIARAKDHLIKNGAMRFDETNRVYVSNP